MPQSREDQIYTIIIIKIHVNVIYNSEVLSFSKLHLRKHEYKHCFLHQ